MWIQWTCTSGVAGENQFKKGIDFLMDFDSDVSSRSKRNQLATNPAMRMSQLRIRRSTARLRVLHLLPIQRVIVLDDNHLQ